MKTLYDMRCELIMLPGFDMDEVSSMSANQVRESYAANAYLDKTPDEMRQISLL
jgi:hypothetical protein